LMILTQAPVDLL